jgi:hypothetical protein
VDASVCEEERGVGGGKETVDERLHASGGEGSRQRIRGRRQERKNVLGGREGARERPALDSGSVVNLERKLVMKKTQHTPQYSLRCRLQRSK